MTPRITPLILATLSLTLGLAAASPAAIVALDPDDSQAGFTTSTTIIPDEGAAWPFGAGDNDDQWGYDGSNNQAQLGSAATNTAGIDNEVWVSRNDLGENVPLLTTTIGGLLDTETYDVYLFYVTHTTDDWRLRAAASGDALVEYDISDGTVIESDGVLQLRRVIVLNDATPTAGALALDIDASAATALGNVRGFFKGVGVDGVAAVIPTPAALPAGLAMIGLIAMRRRAN